MIARTWRGSVLSRDADAYLAYLRQTGLADYRSHPGHVATLGLRCIEGDTAEYLLLTLWTSHDAVRGFAGDDPGRAVFYPEDDRFLVRRDLRVSHYEVVFLEDITLERPAPAPPGDGDGTVGGGGGTGKVMRIDWHSLPGGARAALGWWWHGWLAFVAGRGGLAAPSFATR